MAPTPLPPPSASPPYKKNVLLRLSSHTQLLLWPLSPPVAKRWQYYSAPDSVMKKVGIGLDGQKADSIGDSQTLTCRICCDEYTGKEAFALACTHFFCRGCWAGYLSAKVREHYNKKPGREKDTVRVYRPALASNTAWLYCTVVPHQAYLSLLR